MLRQPRAAIKEGEETIMVRLTCLLMVLIASSEASSVPAIQQNGTARSGTQALAGSTEPDPLPGLPPPPDQPATLLQATPAAQIYGCPDLKSPYFKRDPLLDSACLSHPGWLFDVEMDILGAHVVNHLGENTVPPIFANGGGASVPMAALDWTVSPDLNWAIGFPRGLGKWTLPIGSC